ncbi:MAG: mitochondrial fission ELM1 family protein [Proteobacteria bacterium]|nr:mitochondrial fission ELM1 family protein [Pseudomonadota bacterium]
MRATKTKILKKLVEPKKILGFFFSFTVFLLSFQISAARIVVIDTPLLGERAALLAIGEELSEHEVTVSPLNQYTPQEGDVVLHTLSKAEEINRLIELKTASNNAIKLVNLYDPLVKRSQFDLILLPRHLAPPPEMNLNYAFLSAIPSRINLQKLKEVRSSSIWKALPHPNDSLKIAVLVGGPTKHKAMTSQQAELLGKILNEIQLKKPKTVLAISSSRRSDPKVFDSLIKAGPTANFVFQWKENTRDHENPYIELLSWADIIVVTGDSMSMVSDAILSEKTTFVYAPQGSLEQRHQDFILSLKDWLNPLTTDLKFKSRPNQPTPNAAKEAANQIRKLINANKDSTECSEPLLGNARIS